MWLYFKVEVCLFLSDLATTNTMSSFSMTRSPLETQTVLNVVYLSE